ncbi:hypothetical protein P280DRAFT_550367 [Massarina eburnea CBS 473.64]|uniref:Uncharacterized protein n=1 Tax=Massarina eburnea CBS 473.64 TaxID=1395130 RepID=A0A6A6RWY4_9PLEO|nr:hypothetical protein P280DRAFT_550367 [Massarina eburnea CBS 473.64]
MPTSLSLDSLTVQEATRSSNTNPADLSQHVQEQCLHLASTMHKLLPRELRDMIYQYLYICDKPIPVGSHHFTTYKPTVLETSTPPALPQDASSQYATALISGLGPEAEAHDHSVDPPQDVILPGDHTLDPAYVGRQVAIEASQLYYSSNTFSVCTLENTLPEFLFTDIVSNFPKSPTHSQSIHAPLNITPFDLVHNLQIRVKYEHFDTYRTHYLWGHFTHEQDFLLQIYTNLSALTQRRNELSVPDSSAQLRPPPPALTIEFILMTAFYSLDWNPFPVTDTLRRLTNLFEALRTPLYTLRHDHAAEISVIHHDDGCFPFPMRLTNLFSMSREDWEYEKQALERAKMVYSPLQFLLAPAKDGDPELGFPCRKMDRLLKRRWACSPNLRSHPEWKVSKSAYWPRGRTSRQDRKEMRSSFSAEESE